MIRPSSRSRSRRLVFRYAPLDLAPIILACGAALAGCRSPKMAGPEFPTATELPGGPRHPAGVLVDPAPELPVSVDTASSDGNLVALKPPPPEKAARSVVHAFFRSVVEEDIDRMSDLLTPDATVPSKSRGGSVSLLEHWRGRLRHLKYRPIAGETIYQDSEIETYRYEDLDPLVPRRPPRPLEMDRSDLVLRVPILAVRAGNDRVFGDEILFLLRRDGDRYRIRALFEDFQLP